MTHHDADSQTAQPQAAGVAAGQPIVLTGVKRMKETIMAKKTTTIQAKTMTMPLLEKRLAKHFPNPKDPIQVKPMPKTLSKRLANLEPRDPRKGGIMAPVGTFPWALLQAQRGKQIQRAGWNGKGMTVALAEKGHYISGGRIEADLLPFLVMRTADGKYVPWLISQTDALTTDWSIVT